jgi:glycosyltransferase involved in cell wall biosynthesis
MVQKPMVSVVMITYNHEKYIAEAVNGVFMQKCDFDIEFIIANDKSTDHTNQTINEIIDQTTIPDHIKMRYYNHPNNKGVMKNFIWSLNQAKGNYIALCEGDDYWTDPLKLQKQVDFLEGNPEYVVCCHNASIIDENGNLTHEKKRPELNKDHDYLSLELQKGAFLLTLSMVFRNVLDEYPTSFSKVLNGDTFLISLIGAFGKGRYIEDIKLAAYRVHSGGIWSELDNSKRIKARRVFNEVLMSHYKTKAQLHSFFYDKQVNLSRTLLRNLRSTDTFKDYLDYNFFYIRYNHIHKSKYRLKELLKFNWFYWRDLINNSFS